jgi:DNA-directed RNA polymerase subunit RPC12/RpoP
VPTTTLKIIRKPGANTRTVLMRASAPVLTGRGTTTYLCGACGLTLVKHTGRRQLHELVIKCPGCGSYNEVP